MSRPILVLPRGMERGEEETVYQWETKVKKLFVASAVEHGEAYLFVNPRWKKLDVPAGLRASVVARGPKAGEVLALVLSRRANPPQAIDLNESGLRATLLFNEHGGEYRVYVPWYAVQGLVVKPGEHSYGWDPLPLDLEETFDRRVLLT